MPVSPAPQKTKSLGNFNYSSLQSLMVFWSVPTSVVRPLIEGTGLLPATFEGKSLVNLNFERYAAFGSTFSTVVDEVEFNVVTYPSLRAGTEPELTVAGYLNGEDESKTYGNFRVNVACDSPEATKAGSEKYGEIKFNASFDFAVPDVNDPDVDDWWIRCFAAEKAPKGNAPFIFDMKINTEAQGAPRPTVSAYSPVPASANLIKDGKRHMITSSRNVFGVFQSWTPDAPGGFGEDVVNVTIGDENHLMTRQLKAVFANNPQAVGILLYESQPAAASSHTLITTPLR